MNRARVTFFFLAVGAGCYTTPRTSWPDADFSTGGQAVAAVAERAVAPSGRCRERWAAARA